MRSCNLSNSNTMEALIFDCDGVLVDTERDGHRVAFNRAFEQLGLDLTWDEELYGELLKVSGGKERMRYYFNETGWPDQAEGREDEFIKEAHALKTSIFMDIIEGGELKLRSGVKRMVDEALDDGLRLGVCSTSNQRSVNLVVETMLGPDRKQEFDFILAGDIVSEKKPDPEIYNMALDRLDVPAEKCVVIEDTRNGLLAAKGAGMRCLITKSVYTAGEDFTEADRVVDELGDPPSNCIQIDDLRTLCV